MIYVKIVFITIPLLVLVSSGEELSNKCDLKDGECKKLVYQNLVRRLSVGNESINIPQMEPMELKHEDFTLPNSLKLTLEEGTATGLKKCVFDKLQTILEEPFHTELEILCNIEINAESNIEVPKSVIKEIGGKEIANDVTNGKGKVKIIMGEFRLCLNMPFVFEWKNNDVYLVAKQGFVCGFSLGTSKLLIKELDIGDKLNSEKISEYLKDKTEELNISSSIIKRILIFFQAVVENYLAKRPAKNIYTTDLSGF